MILFSSLKVELAIVEGKLTGWQKAKYIIIPALFLAPISSTAYIISPKFLIRPSGMNTFMQFLCIICSMIITYFGIKFCFKENGRIDGNNFIERYCILLLPVTLRLYLIFLPLTLIMTVIFIAIFKGHIHLLSKYSILFFIFGPIFTLIYYSLLIRSFRRLGNLLEKENSYLVESPVEIVE